MQLALPDLLEVEDEALERARLPLLEVVDRGGLLRVLLGQVRVPHVGGPGLEVVPRRLSRVPLGRPAPLRFPGLLVLCGYADPHRWTCSACSR